MKNYLVKKISSMYYRLRKNLFLELPFNILTIAWLFFFCSCHDFQKAEMGPEKIILDTDMGSDCDDVGALALLHTYANMGKAEIIGCIYSSGKVPFGAGVIEAINIYYGRPDIPIGAYYGNDLGDPVDKMTAQKLAKDTAAFKNNIVYNTDAEEQTRLNRKILAIQEDHSITYLTIGHTKGLYDLLLSVPDDISPLNGFELVEKKIKRWVALGALNANNENRHFVKDWNFFFNGTSRYTKYLVENFPRPVYYIDAGSDVLTGKSLKSTPSGNIVRTAYRDWLWEVFEKTLDDQRPSWDLAAVYFTVEGTGKFLESMGRGWLELDVEKGCRWNTGESELTQFFIVQKESANKNFADYLNKMIVKEPMIRSKWYKNKERRKI